MAEETTKTVAVDVTESVPQPQPSKNNKLYIIMLGVLLFLVVATIGVGFYLTHKPLPKEPEHKVEEMGPLFELDEFVVNLLDYGGRRFLKVKIELELENEKMLEEVEKKKPVIRNYIINILSGQSFNDIKTEEGKNQLRKKIILKINFILKEGKIKDVFFSDFIIQ